MPTTNPAPSGPLRTGPERSAVRHVVIDNPHCLHDDLARAVEQVRNAAAPGDTRGILLTRRSRSLFTVEASADVPYGTTLERDRWHRGDVPESDQAAPVA